MIDLNHDRFCKCGRCYDVEIDWHRGLWEGRFINDAYTVVAFGIISLLFILASFMSPDMELSKRIMGFSMVAVSPYFYFITWGVTTRRLGYKLSLLSVPRVFALIGTVLLIIGFVIALS